MERKREIRHFRDLEVYQKAFKAELGCCRWGTMFAVEEALRKGVPITIDLAPIHKKV